MGEYIRRLRLERGWSQEELGKMCGVNKAAVNKWELGRVENIKRTTVKRLSDIFGVSPCDLMCFDECFDEPEEKTILNLYNRLDDTDKARLLERAETMLEDEKYNKKESSKKMAI